MNTLQRHQIQLTGQKLTTPAKCYKI